MHSPSPSHLHATSSRVNVPMHTLIHPQYVPRRNEIEYIKERAGQRAKRQRQLKEKYIMKYLFAVSLLWLISDSNVRNYYSNGNLKMLSIFHGLQLISLIIYYLLTISDPGYLPINDDNKQQSLQNELNNDDVIVESDDKENATLITKKPKIKTVDLTGTIIPPRFCERCKFYKPQRCKHCYLCDRCVSRYDHHCPLIDHCIGIKNYQLFMSYMTIQGFISFWTLFIAINCLFYSGTINNWIQYGLRIILFIWMLYQCIVAGIMILFHIFVISTGQTSNEYTINSLKVKHENMSNETDQRCCCLKQGEKICNFILCRGKSEYTDGCLMNWIYFVTKRGIQQNWSQPQYPIVIGEY